MASSLLLGASVLLMLTTPSLCSSGSSAASCDITGWWGPGKNGIVQTGSSVHVTAGDLGHGTVNGHKVTMYFENMGGTALIGALSPDCNALTWNNGVQWKRPCPDPPGHLAPGARECGKTCCQPGHVCDRDGCIIQPVLTKIHVVYMTHLDLGLLSHGP